MNKKAIYLISPHGHFDIDEKTGVVMTAGQEDTGGQTVYVTELAKALGKKGHPTFLVTRWFNPVKPELQKIGSNAWLLRVRGGDWGFIRKEEIYSVLSEMNVHLNRFIKREWREMFDEANISSPDIVLPGLFHGHYVDGGIVALEEARHWKVPFFWTSHSLGAVKQQRLNAGRVEEKQFQFKKRISEEKRLLHALAQSGGQVVVSKIEKQYLKNLYQYEPQDEVYIPPGVNTRLFHPLRTHKQRNKIDGLPKKGPIIMMGGRIAKSKGYELAVKAFYEVLQKEPDANLVLFGGSENPTLEESEILTALDDYREKKKIARKIYFLGIKKQEELPQLFQYADVFILPSIYEPFGQIALEAAACGVPLILSKHAGIAVELENESECIVVDPKIKKEFARAIITVLQDKKKAHEMVEQCLKKIASHFSWESIADRHIEYWQKRGVVFLIK